jgi:hypothetical protein
MTACIGTPISWLRLERYALGEAPSERSAVASHLDACAVCRECFAQIERESQVPLPPLPAPKTSERPSERRARGRWFAIGSGVALAAAVLLLIARRPKDGEIEGGIARVKGGDVAFTLVRDDAARIAEAGGTYRDGDRFKVLVTCPPQVTGSPLRGSRSASFDLVVWEDGRASFPLPAASGVECGNDVPLPGAFRLTGDKKITVCLVWNNGPIDRAAVTRSSDGAQHVCKVLEPGL